MGELAGAGNALRTRSLRYLDRGAVLHREREVCGRRYAGTRLVPDQPGEFHHRPAFDGGPQVAFVGDAFLVEGQDIGDGRPRVEECERRVVGLAGE